MTHRPHAFILAIILAAPIGVLVADAPPAAATFDAAFVWPMDGHVTSIYWECRSDCARYHRGVDIANGCGSSIRAARAGVVSVVANDPGGYGNYVMVDHDLGYVTLYGHMSSTSVSVGDAVTTSTQLGIEGATGAATGCHVHFEIRQDDEASETKQFVPGEIGDTIVRGDAIPFATRLVRVARATSLLDGPDVRLVSGQGAATLGTAEAGDRLTAHAERTSASGATWLAVSWQGRDAWIDQSDAATISGEVRRITADGALNVRSGAGTANSIVGRVYGGQAYAPLASAVDSGGATWFQIPYGSGTGWIHGGFTTSVSLAAPVGLVGKIIAVDPGHGGSDSGAGGFGLNEKDVTLAIGLELRDLIEAEGATVVMTRETDATVSLDARTDLANAQGAHRFVSIHANACGSCGAEGTETYYHDSLSSTSTSAKLAGSLQTHVVDAFGSRDRGVKQANFHVLRETSMPAALVETGFIDDADDNARLANPATQRAIALAILHAIQEHFGVALHDPFGAAWDFESSAAGWTYANVGGPAAWAITTARAASPTHALALRNYGADESDSATSPSVRLGASPTLSFSTWIEGERSCLPMIGDLLPAVGCTVYDAGRVEVSNDGAATWTTLLADHWSTGGAFEERTIDLSAYANEVVQVRFVFMSDGSVHGEGWYVDDVSLG